MSSAAAGPFFGTALSGPRPLTEGRRTFSFRGWCIFMVWINLQGCVRSCIQYLCILGHSLHFPMVRGHHMQKRQQVTSHNCAVAMHDDVTAFSNGAYSNQYSFDLSHLVPGDRLVICGRTLPYFITYFGMHALSRCFLLEKRGRPSLPGTPRLRQPSRSSDLISARAQRS